MADSRKLSSFLMIGNSLLAVGIIGFLLYVFVQDKLAWEKAVADHKAKQAAAIAAAEEAEEQAEKSGAKFAEGPTEGADIFQKAAKRKLVPTVRVVVLDPFDVSLPDEDGTPRFAKIELSIRVKDDRAEVALNDHMPKIRDIILTKFMSLPRFGVLNDTDYRAKLKAELTKEIEQAFWPGAIRGIYFRNLYFSS